MRRFSGLFRAAVLATGVAGGAHAQTPLRWSFGALGYFQHANPKTPPNAVCEAQGPSDNSSLQLSASGSGAMMLLSLGYVRQDQDGAATAYTYFDGPAHLQFTSASAGTISYDIVSANNMRAPAVRFSDYSAVYDQGNNTLAVAMTVTMVTYKPCGVKITALYRMP